MFCASCCCCVWLILGFLLIKLALYYRRRPRIRVGDFHYVLVTGCDTGFGNLLCKRLDSLGCHVFAGCATDKAVDDLKKSCSKRLHAIKLDVADEASVRKAFEHVSELLPKGRGLWGVVNNAGIRGCVAPMEWLTLEDYKDGFAVNLFGIVSVVKAFLPLVKRERGRIVNMCSVLGRLVLPHGAIYGATKHGVEAITTVLRREMYDFGVSVHIIEPGYHRTGLSTLAIVKESYVRAWEKLDDSVRNDYGEEYIEKTVQHVLNTNYGLSSDRLTDVIDAYEHALFACYPKDRYVVGFDAVYVWWYLRYLPDWLADLLHRLVNRNRPKPRGAIQ